MASVMVLVLGKDASLANVADAVVAGAKSVRFTEVMTRAVEPDVFRYRLLDAGESLSSCDGIVVVASGADSTASASAVLGRLSLDRARVDTVLAHVGGVTSLAAELIATGGIVVSSTAESSDERAWATGERVARVAGWVRHALGHEHDAKHHDHQHGHAHTHEPDRGHHH